MYRYFISFTMKKDGRVGFGNAGVWLSGLIQSEEDILTVGKIIAASNKILPENLVILNFKLWGD